MNDQQLEAVLRSSLARHADTVTSGPTWPLADDELTGHQDADDVLAGDDLAEHRARRRGPNTWWAVAATVAAVLAVIGVVLAVGHASSDHTRPATPVTITRTACETALPKAWSDAINAGTLSEPPASELFGIGPRGELLIARPLDQGITDRGELVLTRLDGTTQPIMQVDLGAIYHSSASEDLSAIDEHWIVVPLKSAGPKAATARLELIDRSNVHAKREVPISTNPDLMALFDNHVYWVNASKGRATGTLQDYDIATGKSRVLTTEAKDLASSQYGVAWTDTHDASHVVAGQDPTAVPDHPGRQSFVVTDGPNYAWWTGSGIGWYSKLTKQTVYVPNHSAAKYGRGVEAVAGPYVVEFIDTDVRVIDTRTGAVAQLSGVTPIGHVISSGGVAAFGGVLSRLRLDALPGLRC
jgi:hypothetical protein